MNRLQVVRCLFKVVQTDDTFGVAEAGDITSDVFFKINILDTFGDRAAQ